MLMVKCVAVGRLFSNSYVIFDSESKEGIIIDAGDEAEKIFSIVKNHGVAVKGIFLTHGHFDHVLALKDLEEKLGCGFYIHKEDERILSSAPSDAKTFLGIDVPPPPKPDGWLQDGQTITIGRSAAKVIHTPGHTPGSVCFVFDGFVFTGDLLFAGSIGRTDMPGGDLNSLLSSIKNKLFKLPDDYLVYPGHGPSTMIGVEKSMNPFVGKDGVLGFRGF